MHFKAPENPQGWDTQIPKRPSWGSCMHKERAIPALEKPRAPLSLRAVVSSEKLQSIHQFWSKLTLSPFGPAGPETPIGPGVPCSCRKENTSGCFYSRASLKPGDTAAPLGKAQLGRTVWWWKAPSTTTAFSVSANAFEVAGTGNLKNIGTAILDHTSNTVQSLIFNSEALSWQVFQQAFLPAPQKEILSL